MKKEGNDKPTYSAPALSKGLDILELMVTQAEGVSLKEICELLGRQKSELFRMMVVLEERGYVKHVRDSDKYTITSKLLGLAHQQPVVRRLSSIADPFMRELANRAEQSCHLVIERGSSGMVIAQKDSPTDRRFGLRVGTRLSLQASGSGNVLLAFADDKTRDSMMSGIPASRHMPMAVMQELVQVIRAQGYQCMESKTIPGVWDISYPIYDYTGMCVAALCVPFLSYLDNSQAMGREDVRLLLQEIASQLSRELGAEDEVLSVADGKLRVIGD